MSFRHREWYYPFIGWDLQAEREGEREIEGGEEGNRQKDRETETERKKAGI